MTRLRSFLLGLLLGAGFVLAALVVLRTIPQLLVTEDWSPANPANHVAARAGGGRSG